MRNSGGCWNVLLNPQISAAEISAFAGIYPNANYMISDNLLTQAQTPGGAFFTGAMPHRYRPSGSGWRIRALRH